jgi:hypothetical protein
MYYVYIIYIADTNAFHVKCDGFKLLPIYIILVACWFMKTLLNSGLMPLFLFFFFFGEETQPIRIAPIRTLLRMNIHVGQGVDD